MIFGGDPLFLRVDRPPARKPLPHREIPVLGAPHDGKSETEVTTIVMRRSVLAVGAIAAEVFVRKLGAGSGFSHVAPQPVAARARDVNEQGILFWEIKTHAFCRQP